MKRFFSIFSAAVMLLTSVFLFPVLSQAEQGFSFVVADANLTLYDEPWDYYGQGRSVREGDTLFYLGESKQYNGYTWYAVLYDGACVYLCARYGTLYTNVTRVRTTSSVALRIGAGTENARICYIPAGQTPSLIGFHWDLNAVLWYRVRWENQEGYISSRYAELVDDDASFSSVRATLTEKTMATRSGPSTKYYETGSFFQYGASVKLFTRVYDNVNEIWWVQAEAYENGSAMRVYTGSWRFADLNVYSLPEEYALYYASLNRSCTLRMGPGDGYGYYKTSVVSGQNVTVYNVENGWAQIECTINGVRYRGWVEQSSLYGGY